MRGKRRNIFIVLLLPAMSMIWPGTTYATKKNIEHIKSFTASAPDTVIQGETFKVEYRLEATHWQNGSFNDEPGVVMTDLKSSIVESTPYHTYLVAAKFITSRLGTLTIPAMKVEIDGKMVESEARSVYVMQNQKYGKEMTAATEWLTKKGANVDSLCLTMTLASGELYVFSNQMGRTFCVVAKKDLWDKIGNPILAYSLESNLFKDFAKVFSPYFLDEYNKQLKGIRTGNTSWTMAGNIGEKHVAPLLGDIRWGQMKPYNSKLPTYRNKRTLVGCVPLAMSMIMKYHNYPSNGSSRVFSRNENQTFSIDYSKIKFDWPNYKNEYDTLDIEACAGLSKILGTIAFSTSPKYGTENTSVSMMHVKHVMCNNLGYSAKMTLRPFVPNHEVKEILRHELDAGRPSIVSRVDHAFVCDGYDGDFFHFNMGWCGLANGYYQLMPDVQSEAEATETSFFNQILYGIEPQKGEHKREVTLTQPGTLGEILTESEKQNLTDLTVSGPINSDDIHLLRGMAGAQDDTVFVNRMYGSLRKLNLSNARIVSDPNPFLERKAESKLSGYQERQSWKEDEWGNRFNYEANRKDFEYDFGNMDEKQFKQLKSRFGKLMKKKGYRFYRADDGLYYEQKYCVKNIISAEMFFECSSLTEIKLPESIKSIEDYAFARCTSLVQVTIPKKVANLGESIFEYCLSLEKLHCPFALHVGKNQMGDNHSPGFKLENY